MGKTVGIVSRALAMACHFLRVFDLNFLFLLTVRLSLEFHVISLDHAP